MMGDVQGIIDLGTRGDLSVLVGGEVLHDELAPLASSCQVPSANVDRCRVKGETLNDILDLRGRAGMMRIRKE